MEMSVKKYTIEMVIMSVQLFMFYIFPLFAGPTDAMGMVFLILCSVFVFAMLEGAFSPRKIKFAWPFAVSLLFLPSVPIWYNSSAFVHALWYLVISAVGLALGCFIRWIVRCFSRKRGN